MGGIPQNYTVDVNLDLVTPVELAGLPTNYHLDIGSLPKIQIGVDPITINPITVNPLTLNPLDISVRVKEAPSIRAHVPANFTVGFSVLGIQLACIRLCGEAQVITEPYVPNPCEPCGAAPFQTPLLFPNPGTITPAAAGPAKKRAGKV
jgi:hypothetical protein